MQDLRKARSKNRRSRYATFVCVLALSAAMTVAGPQRAQAADECGVGPAVTCTGANYPAGITYSTGAAAQTVTLDNPNMTATGVVAVSGSSAGDIVLNATRFQSVTTNGVAALSVINSPGSGSAFLTMDSGAASSNIAGVTGTLFATTNLGTTLITLNGGSVENTANTGTAVRSRYQSGAASIVMTGGSVTSAGAGLLADTLFNALTPISVTLTGGSVQSALDGVSSVSQRGSATTTMTGGSINSGGNGLVANVNQAAATANAFVTMQNGTIVSTGNAVSGILARNAGTGSSGVLMSGGSVSASGNNSDGIFALSTSATGTFNVSLTGGTVTGGVGNGSGIHTSAISGGTLAIGSGVTVNGGASGVAIRDGDANRDGIDEIGGAVTLTTAGTLNGAIVLGLGNDVVNVTGGAINGDVTGGGAADLNFNLGANSFTYGAPYTISGMDAVTMTSGLAQLDGTLSTNTLAVNGGMLVLNGAAASTGGTSISAGALAVGWPASLNRYQAD